MSDGDNKNDLTRIEDLSEFLHQGDDELDKLLADLDESNEDSNNENEADEAEIELAPFEYSNNSEENFDDDTYESEEEFDNDNNEDDSYDDAEYAFDESDLNDQEDALEEDLEDNQVDFQNDFQEDDQTDFNEDFASFEDQNTEGQEETSFDDFENFENDEDEILEDEQLEDQEDEEAEIELSPFEEEETQEDNNSYQEAPQQEELTEPEIQAYEQVETPLTATPETVAPEIKVAQDFGEVRDFAANSTYGKVAIGGNPPFSILMQGITPGQYDESILAILNEHGLLGDNEDLYRTGLESGQLLIAQIGEFSAIYLAGKLRRYCRVIKVGLAHEIHASPNYDHSDQRGLTGPRSINQNKSKHFVRNNKEFNQEDVLLSSSHFVPGYLITHSLGPMQINEVIDGNEFNDIKSINLIEYFSDQFKESAFKKGANAIISIHFTVNHHNKDSASNDIIIMAHGDYVVLEENKA